MTSMLQALRSPLRGPLPSSASFSRQPASARDTEGRDSLLLQSFTINGNAAASQSLQRVEGTFPNPMGGPSTSTSAGAGGVSSPPLLLTASSGGQLHQLAALIGILCGIQRHHCLVVHEWGSSDDVQPGHTIPLACTVPQLVPVVEFIITRATREEQLCTFLLHADSNHTVVDSHRRGPGSGVDRGGAAPRGHFRFPSNSTSAETDDHTAAQNSTNFDLAQSSGAGGLHSGVPKVVFLYNICQASRSVQSTLMDLLNHSIITVNNTARRVPQLRVVAFCGSEQLQFVPMHLRASFLVSTYVTAAGLRSAQASDAHGNVSSQLFSARRCQDLYLSFAASRSDIHAGSGRGGAGNAWQQHQRAAGFGSTTPSPLPRNQLLLMLPTHHSLGEPVTLLDYVYVAPCVERYLRHLLGVVRGSLSPVTSQAPGILSKYDSMIEVLKALVWLLHVPQDPSSHHTGGATERLMVGPTEVQCLLAHWVTHNLHMPRREWGLMCGDSGGSSDVLSPPVNELTQVSAVAGMTAASFGSALGGADTALRRQYLQSGTAQPAALWSSAVGLPLMWSAEWDALAASRRHPTVGNAETMLSQLNQTQRRSSNTLPAGLDTRRPPASSESSMRIAGSDELMATLRSGAASTRMERDVSFGALPFDDGSATCLPYVWCRHLVAAALRERSTPPPG